MVKENIIFEEILETPFRWGFKIVFSSEENKKILIYEIKRKKEIKRIQIIDDLKSISVSTFFLGLNLKGRKIAKEKAYIEVSPETDTPEKYPQFLQRFLNVKGKTKFTWAALTDGERYIELNYKMIGEGTYLSHKEAVEEIAKSLGLEIKTIKKFGLFGKHFGKEKAQINSN